jgi:hypothetical protein
VLLFDRGLQWQSIMFQREKKIFLKILVRYNSIVIKEMFLIMNSGCCFLILDSGVFGGFVLLRVSKKDAFF